MSLNRFRPGGVQDKLVVDYCRVDGEACDARSTHDYTIDPSKTGYTPLGVVGTSLSSSSRSTIVYAYLSNGNINVRVLNTSDSAYTPGKLTVYVLYQKN